MLRIGIECESIESPQSWGVGRIVKKLLEEIANRPELAKEFRFFLYFKSEILNYPFLANPIFVKKTVLKHSHILKNVRMNSFILYYYIFLPIKLWFERLDMMFFPNYMLSPLFLGKSLVMLTEDIYHEMHRPDLPWRYKLAYKIFAGWWAARHATKIMAISETSKHELTKLFNIEPERIVINQLGVDKLKLKIENLKLIENWKLKIENYILYVGQAFPRRHLCETMLAFESLVLELKTYNLQLVAIGKDKYNPPIIDKLKREINARLGREAIVWKEYVSEEELATLYANAQCVVYVSSKEAFGLPPLEALAYGTVPVVADEPINHEIYGENAFFVNPVRGRPSSVTAAGSNGVGEQYTPESIAKAIKEALTNEQKRHEIIQSAPEILAKYTWPKHTERFLRIVRGL